MRSAVLAAVLVLAGCDQGPPPKDRAETILITDGASAEPSADAASAASAATAKPSPKVPAPNPEPTKLHFQALGTEPFWAVDVMTGKLRYSSPEVSGITFTSTEMKDGKGTRYSGSMNGKAISLLIEPGKCSDGMSDTVYQWKAALTIAGKTEQGCARAK